ncbi:MAG: hypothetical protein LBK25_08195 [Treponema sp.]|jgi:hypothetical protein|nr:hypothetical protein [Treponema sp.]
MYRFMQCLWVLGPVYGAVLMGTGVIITLEMALMLFRVGFDILLCLCKLNIGHI